RRRTTAPGALSSARRPSFDADEWTLRTQVADRKSHMAEAFTYKACLTRFHLRQRELARAADQPMGTQQLRAAPLQLLDERRCRRRTSGLWPTGYPPGSARQPARCRLAQSRQERREAGGL